MAFQRCTHSRYGDRRHSDSSVCVFVAVAPSASEYPDAPLEVKPFLTSTTLPAEEALDRDGLEEGHRRWEVRRRYILFFLRDRDGEGPAHHALLEHRGDGLWRCGVDDGELELRAEAAASWIVEHARGRACGRRPAGQ